MEHSATFSAIPAFRLTDHAAVRLQQRGIPGWYLALLLQHGKTLTVSPAIEQH